MKTYYDDGKGIVIYHGHAIELLDSMPPVTLLLTDIPYGEVNRESNGLRNLDKGKADVVTFEIPMLMECIKDKAESYYVWCGTEQVSEIRKRFVSFGLSSRLCIWEKTNPSPMNGEHIWLSSIECCVFAKRSGAPFGLHCASPVFRCPTKSTTEHPTEKPLSLFQKLIICSTYGEGQTILDPFMGSGTTLRAAKDLGRKAIGIEIEERYCEIAARRLQQEVLALT